MREIGVRLALGAMPSQIRAMMLGQGMRLLGSGLLLGFVGAFAVSRVIRSLLFGVSANDPLIYGDGHARPGRRRPAGLLDSRAPRFASRSDDHLARRMMDQ